MADFITFQHRMQTESGGKEGWNMFTSDGAPTTQFDGTAPKGSLCIDTTNGVLYINTGTKASNTWTIVGSQS